MRGSSAVDRVEIGHGRPVSPSGQFPTSGKMVLHPSVRQSNHYM